MNILITICARGGSKGIPGKNIKALNGKPLIHYSIELAKKFQECRDHVDIALSSDSDEIILVSEQGGLITEYKRPDKLGTDVAGKIEVIRDVLLFHEKKNEKKYDFVIDLDVTSPLRNLKDLYMAFEMLKKDSEALNIFSVSPANRSPYFNMVEQKENGYYFLVNKLEKNVMTRQSAPSVYDLNASFYIYTKKYFEEGHTSAITNKSLIYEVPHICFDLDHPIDFEFISYLLINKKLDFEL